MFSLCFSIIAAAAAQIYNRHSCKCKCTESTNDCKNGFGRVLTRLEYNGKHHLPWCFAKSVSRATDLFFQTSQTRVSWDKKHWSLNKLRVFEMKHARIYSFWMRAWAFITFLSWTTITSWAGGRFLANVVSLWANRSEDCVVTSAKVVVYVTAGVCYLHHGGYVTRGLFGCMLAK